MTLTASTLSFYYLPAYPTTVPNKTHLAIAYCDALIEIDALGRPL